MAFRFPQRPPRDAAELFQWLRELLPDLELKILENCPVGTTKTAVAHGLGCVPFFVRCSTPHCIAVVRQVQKADAKNVYLRATNACVVDVLVVKYAQLAQLVGALKSVRNGGYELPDWDPSGTALGDHKVAVDQTDEDAGGADYLEAKSAAGVGQAQSVVEIDGVRKLETRSLGLTVAVHGDNPDVLYQTVRGKYPIRTNVQGDAPARYVEISVDPTEADPVVVASTLYPAKIVDPLNRGFITCVYLGPHYAGGNTPMLIGWTPVATGVLEYPTPGPIASTWLDGVSVETYGSDGYSSMVGKTVLAYYQGDTSELGDEEPLQQLYVIEDTGAHFENYGTPSQSYVTTKPRLRRITAYSTSSQWVHGMTFQIQAGNVYGTDFFTFDNAAGFVLGTDFIEWVHTEGPTFTWSDRYELLTGPQLTSEGASTATETWDLTMASGDADATAVETLLGTPGVTTIPAAAWTFDVEAIHIDAVPSGTTTTLRVEVRADNGVTAPILFTAESPPIVNTSPAALSFATDYAGTTIANTDRLVAIYRLHTDSPTPVTLHIRYNSATRGTRITVPFQMAITGGADGDHQHLSNRDQDVGLGEEACHPADAIGAGFLHTPFATSTITAGLLPSPTRNYIIATLASGTELKWIGTTKMSAGDKVTVHFVDSLILRHGDGSPPANSAPLWLNGSDFEDRDINWLSPAPFGNCVACFQLRTDATVSPTPCWYLLWTKMGELLT